MDHSGFLFGPTLAARLGCAFVPVRKAGKLPGKCIKVAYSLEYGSVSLPFLGVAEGWEGNADLVEFVAGHV